MKIDKVELSGLVVLSVGIILMAFTFFSAWGFLVGNLSIIGSQNLIQAFGEALAPLIESVIRILYLGIMGWVGSIVTIRAVQLLRKERVEIPISPPQPIKMEDKHAAKQEKFKPEVKEKKAEEEKLVEAKKPSREDTESPQKPEQEHPEKSEEVVPPPPMPTPAA